MQVVAVADDLSGATETLAALGLWGSKVWLNTENPKGLLNEIDSGKDLVIDANSRQLKPHDAKLKAKHAANLVSNLPNDALVFRKADSLLRGNLAVDVAEAALHGPVVMAMANPETGRTTVDGKVLVNGQALEATNLWHLEKTKPWPSIAAAISPLTFIEIPLEQVRSDTAKLVEILRDAAATKQVIICDSETTEDLDSIVKASSGISHVQFVGTAGLAKALGKSIRPQSPTIGFPEVRNHDVAVVVGSGAEASQKQLQVLANHGIHAYSLGQGLAALPALDVGQSASLVLTGGETARVVLDELGVDWIRPFIEIENAVVCSEASNGQIVVTKPGSYGDEEALLRSVNFLKQLSKHEMSQK